MSIDSSFPRWIGAAAVTICPVIFIDPDVEGAKRERLLVHEWIHWWQQLLFGAVGALIGVIVWLVLSWPPQPMTGVLVGLGAVEGWVAGQLLWRGLYLFCLPRWYNYFRRRWETAAFRAQGLPDDEIKRILRGPPYYLR